MLKPGPRPGKGNVEVVAQGFGFQHNSIRGTGGRSGGALCCGRASLLARRVPLWYLRKLSRASGTRRSRVVSWKGHDI